MKVSVLNIKGKETGRQVELSKKVFEKKHNSNTNNFVELFITLDQKLINFDFNKYSIKSFKKLDELNKSKILDYSLEIS